MIFRSVCLLNAIFVETSHIENMVLCLSIEVLYHACYVAENQHFSVKKSCQVVLMISLFLSLD
jgi:hypothetical protein